MKLKLTKLIASTIALAIMSTVAIAEDGEEKKDFEESNTIEELKAYAEANGFDGFARYTATPSEEWQRSVWFKKCSSVQLNEHLTHALVKTNNVD